MKLQRSTLLFALTAPALVLSACSNGDGGAASGEDVTIRVVNAFPETDLLTAGYVELERQLSERSETITLENLGGAEVVPNFELGTAVQDGVIDAFVAPNYHLDVVPEARALVMSELSIEEEIERGAIEYMNEIHNERLNAQYIGRLSATDFSYYLRDEISEISDFEGLKLRGSPGHIPLAQGLGYELMQIPGGELYTALERGAVDGFAWGTIGTVDSAYHEQISYRVEPTFWNMDVVMVVNLDVWNGMSEEQRTEFMEIFADVQETLPGITQEFADAEDEVFAEAGVETIDLGPEFRQRVFDDSWEWMRENEPNAEELEPYFRP